MLFPAGVFGFLYAWPVLERRLTGDHLPHNLLDRPRDTPRRTAVGAALMALVASVFFAGAADRAFVEIGIGYETQVWMYRGITLLLPVLTYVTTRRICEGLRASGSTPTNPLPTRLRRSAGGGWTTD